jgi:hypothetical protein
MTASTSMSFPARPSLSAPRPTRQISKRFAISGAWSVQVAGRATDVPESLDLVKFTRQQAVLRVEYNF